MLGSHSPIIQIHTHIHSGYSCNSHSLVSPTASGWWSVCSSYDKTISLQNHCPSPRQIPFLPSLSPCACLDCLCSSSQAVNHEYSSLTVPGICSNICPLLIGRGLSSLSSSPMASFFRVELSTMKGFTVCKGVRHQASHNTAKREKPSGDTWVPVSAFSGQHWTTYHTRPTENRLQRHSYLNL